MPGKHGRLGLPLPAFGVVCGIRGCVVKGEGEEHFRVCPSGGDHFGGVAGGSEVLGTSSAAVLGGEVCRQRGDGHPDISEDRSPETTTPQKRSAYC
jgi:hypothetical protein